MPDSSPDNQQKRIRAADTQPPSRAEIEQLKQLADEDIRTDDIPDLSGTTESEQGRYVCLRTDDETMRLLQSRGNVAEQVREAIRAYTCARGEDAA